MLHFIYQNVTLLPLLSGSRCDASGFASGPSRGPSRRTGLSCRADCGLFCRRVGGLLRGTHRRRRSSSWSRRRSGLRGATSWTSRRSAGRLKSKADCGLLCGRVGGLLRGNRGTSRGPTSETGLVCGRVAGLFGGLYGARGDGNGRGPGLSRCSGWEECPHQQRRPHTFKRFARRIVHGCISRPLCGGRESKVHRWRETGQHTRIQGCRYASGPGRRTRGYSHGPCCRFLARLR